MWRSRCRAVRLSRRHAPPGLQFGPPDKRYLATYRPPYGWWNWKEIATTPPPPDPCTLKPLHCLMSLASFFPPPALVSGKPGHSGIGLIRNYPQAILGSPQAVPLPALYDEDDLVDIAVYEPEQARFILLLSTNNWKATPPIIKSFGPTFAPNPTGLAIDRSGAFPLTGMQAFERRVFSLFFPGDGSWNTNWSPASPLENSIEKCTTGKAGFDVPVAGFDHNRDGYTDLLYYTTDQPNRIDFEWRYSGPACATAGPKFHFTGRNFSRVRVFPVYDMTGDSRPEMMFWDTETNTVWWTTSDSGYQTEGSEFTIKLPSRAILL